MKKTALLVAKFAASIVILALLAHNAEGPLEELGRERTDGARLAWNAAGAAVLCLIAVLISFLRWHGLARALGLAFRRRDSLRLGFVGYLLNFMPLGTVGGDLVKAVLIAREQHGRRAEAVASVFVDRLIGLLALFLVASIAILATGQLASANETVRAISRMTLVCASLGGVCFGILLTPGVARVRFIRWLFEIPKVGPLSKKLVLAVQLYRGQPRALFVAGVLSLTVHAVNTTGFFLIARGLLPEYPSLGTQFVAVPIALTTGLLPLPASGLGAMEAVLDLLFRILPGDVAIPPGHGLLVGLGYRAATILIAMVGVVVYLTSRREVAAAYKDAQGAEIPVSTTLADERSHASNQSAAAPESTRPASLGSLAEGNRRTREAPAA